MSEFLVETPGGTLYIGPLSPAKRFARSERRVKVTVNRGHTVRTVEFHDHPDEPSVAEFGRAPDQHMAWRYALGALFGPLDDQYEEDRLAALLKEFS